MDEIIEAFFRIAKLNCTAHALIVFVASIMCQCHYLIQQGMDATVLLNEHEHKWWKVRGAAANKFEDHKNLRRPSLTWPVLGSTGSPNAL